MGTQKCSQCGKCCKSLYLTLTQKDFDLWEETIETGTDIEAADQAVTALSHADTGLDGFWRKGADEPHPTPDHACPLLMYQPHTGQYICRINMVKPEVCRGYQCN